MAIARTILDGARLQAAQGDRDRLANANVSVADASSSITDLGLDPAQADVLADTDVASAMVNLLGPLVQDRQLLTNTPDLPNSSDPEVMAALNRLTSISAIAPASLTVVPEPSADAATSFSISHNGVAGGFKLTLGLSGSEQTVLIPVGADRSAD